LIDRQLIMVPHKTWFFTVTFTVTFDFLAAGLCTPPTFSARRLKRRAGDSTGGGWCIEPATVGVCALGRFSRMGADGRIVRGCAFAFD
jgi:hypothetical protein